MFNSARVPQLDCVYLHVFYYLLFFVFLFVFHIVESTMIFVCISPLLYVLKHVWQVDGRLTEGNPTDEASASSVHHLYIILHYSHFAIPFQIATHSRLQCLQISRREFMIQILNPTDGTSSIHHFRYP